VKSHFSHFATISVLAGATVCAKQDLTFDNDGNKFLSLTIDGTDKGLILPGTDKTYDINAGAATIVLKDRKGTVVFNGQKNFAADKSYLFSLNGKNEYTINSEHYSVSNGRSSRGGLYQKKPTSTKQRLTDTHWIEYNASYYAPNQSFPSSVVIKGTARSTTRWGLRIKPKYYYKAANIEDLKFYYENDPRWNSQAFATRYLYAKTLTPEACEFLLAQVKLGYKTGLYNYISSNLSKIPAAYQSKISTACGDEKKWSGLKRNIIASSADRLSSTEFIKLYSEVDDVVIPRLNSTLCSKHKRHLDGMLKHKKLRPVDYNRFRTLYAKDKARLSKVMELVKVSSLGVTDLNYFLTDLLGQPMTKDWVKKAIAEYKELGKRNEELNLALEILSSDIASCKDKITAALDNRGFNARQFTKYLFAGPVFSEKQLTTLQLLFPKETQPDIAAHLLLNASYAKRVDVKKWLLGMIKTTPLKSGHKGLLENHPVVFASYINGLSKEQLSKLDYNYTRIFNPLDMKTFKPFAGKVKTPQAKEWVYSRALVSANGTDEETMKIKLYMASPKQRFDAFKTYLRRKRLKDQATAMRDPVVSYAYKLANKHRKLYDDIFAVQKFTSPGYLKEPEKKKRIGEAKTALKSANPELVQVAAKFLWTYMDALNKEPAKRLLMACLNSQRTPRDAKVGILQDIAAHADDAWLKAASDIYKTSKTAEEKLAAFKAMKSGVAMMSFKDKTMAIKVLKRLDAIHAAEADAKAKESLTKELGYIKHYRKTLGVLENN